MGFVSLDDLTSIFTSLNTKLRKKPTAIRLTQAEYDELTSEEKHDTSKTYFITDEPDILHDNVSYGGGGSGVEIDDTTIATDKVWSSRKTSDEIANNTYTLPTASANTLGGVKVSSGSGLYINSSGQLKLNLSNYMSILNLGLNNDVTISPNSIANLTLYTNTADHAKMLYNSIIINVIMADSSNKGCEFVQWKPERMSETEFSVKMTLRNNTAYNITLYATSSFAIVYFYLRDYNS